MIGIKISAHFIRLVHWDGTQVRKFVEEPIPSHLQVNGNKIDYEEIGKLLQKLVKEHKFSGKECAIVLPSYHVFMRRMALPEMEENQLKLNLPYEFRDFISGNQEEYRYQYTIHRKYHEGEARMMDLTVAAVDKQIIEQYRTMCKTAGLRLKVAVPVEFAYANLIKRYGDPEQEYCFVDFGTAVTAIHIFRGIHHEATRIIEYSREMVDAIREASREKQLPLTDAQEVYRSIAIDIRKAINFYGFNNRDSNLTELWCSGVGARIDSLLEVVAETTQMQVHFTDELVQGEASTTLELSRYGEILGAMLQPIKSSMNLALQPEKQAVTKKFILPLVAVSLVGAVLFGKFAVIDRFDALAEMKAQTVQMEQEVALLTAETADYVHIQEQYQLYGTDWMTEEEQAYLQRTEILELVEQLLMTQGKVLSVALNQNVLAVYLQTDHLETAATVVEQLSLQEDVKQVAVHTANHPETKGKIVVALTITLEENGGGSHEAE